MSEAIKELSSKDFDKFVSEGDSIVDFSAEWCGPCKMLKPIFDEVAKDMKGKVKFAKVDVDGNQDLADRFGVMSVPAIICFKDGEQTQMHVGFADKKRLVELIKSAF